MGRIVKRVTIENPNQPEKQIVCNALVDTGAAYMTLPNEWRELLGDVKTVEEVQCATANGATVSGELVAPTVIKIDGFRPVYTEVLFIDMEAGDDESHEPLIGHLPLQHLNVAVDMVGHRLVHAKYIDLK